MGSGFHSCSTFGLMLDFSMRLVLVYIFHFPLKNWRNCLICHVTSRMVFLSFFSVGGVGVGLRLYFSCVLLVKKTL